MKKVAKSICWCFVSVISLTSCDLSFIRRGGSSSTTSSYSSTSNQATSKSVSDIKDSGLGNILTKEEWDEAFKSVDNYTVSGRMYDNRNSNADIYSEFDNNSLYSYQKSYGNGTQSELSYYFLTDNSTYYHRFHNYSTENDQNNKYNKNVYTSSTQYYHDMNEYEVFSNMVLSSVFSYENMYFNTYQNSYELKEDIKMDNYIYKKYESQYQQWCSVTFENKKIVKLYVGVVTDDSDEGHIELGFMDFGTTGEIKLPDDCEIV